MNGYKDIVKSQKLRFAILNALKIVPDKSMIQLQYKIKMGYKLNLKKPIRFTEKLQWYKLYYRDPLMTKCADKYEMRNCLSEWGYEDLACKLYGVYDSPEQIPLEDLPEKFVIKTTNGSGTNVFCPDKNSLDWESTKQELNGWLHRDCYGLGREWAYKNIVPRLVVEEYLEDTENPYEGINDYKFICFNGQAKYIVFDADRFVGHRRNIYDAQWNYLNIGTDCDKIGDIIPVPDGLSEMFEIANNLAKSFPFVRVDLYWVNHRTYFGELTFYPWTGYVQFDPDSFDCELGKQFELPKKFKVDI